MLIRDISLIRKRLNLIEREESVNEGNAGMPLLFTAAHTDTM